MLYMLYILHSAQIVWGCIYINEQYEIETRMLEYSLAKTHDSKKRQKWQFINILTTRSSLQLLSRKRNASELFSAKNI